MEYFKELCEPTDESFQSMKLDELLDVDDSFVHVYYHGKDWSVVDLACTCKYCYQWAVCAHSALVAMCFDSTLRVPDAWEQAEPGLRKARGRRGVGAGRGIAGVKRRLKLVKTIEKEKRDGVRKASLMKIKGPLAKDVAGPGKARAAPPSQVPTQARRGAGRAPSI